MKNEYLKNLPYMLYADKDGQIYDHPYFRMAGFSGCYSVVLGEEDLMPMPEFSKLFFIPDCPPIGLDPSTGEFKTVSEIEVDGVVTKCFAVAAFIEPGLVRSHLPAVDYGPKSYILPMWAYTAVGFMDESYWTAAFRIEYNHKWDPRNYDDRELIPAIEKFQKEQHGGPLVDHLINCATKNHCFAAKNLFLKRWEAPLPVSQTCNAACLGCLSLQPDLSCEASHERISFTPSKEEIVALAVKHLDQAPEAIVSFGQGCEGEPLMEHSLIADSIREIRRKTNKGTINLNTNGSWPERMSAVAKSGLDSVRISLNSARPEFYKAYCRPKNYDLTDVAASISLSKEMGLYTMINYLVFPGITDQEDEIEALGDLIEKTGVNFVHLKNLDIDPQLYMQNMPAPKSKAIGMKQMVDILRQEFPDVELGYFNKPVRADT
ncbi:MAG: radical SAM protein [Deltaproteobacteria bacterium]|nr:radical SAM protein [Deltaproteobacteria bacterium]MBW1908356.1 radical SAM protein [Deltaproteobacteria bacterium]MBW2033198.1 radical SAM protein [Deltaproteobacteria bacterium]MBW2114604.1 radical SAM protein [Deltaproteobacteria bacterium]